MESSFWIASMVFIVSPAHITRLPTRLLLVEAPSGIHGLVASISKSEWPATTTAGAVAPARPARLVRSNSLDRMQQCELLWTATAGGSPFFAVANIY